MDNKLFNKEDILTILTADKAKIGDKGYFGDNLKEIEFRVERDEVYPLVWIDRKNLSVYSFKNNFFEDHFALFLPVDKVKCKEIIYRPLRSIDELFDFLMPDFDVETICGPDSKIELLLGKKIKLRRKEDNLLFFVTIGKIVFYEWAIFYINEISMRSLFEEYELERNGKFVPFGIEVEEQDSERSKDKDVDTSLSDYMDKRIKEISEE